MYELCRLTRAFDPNFAALNIDSAFVKSMSQITPLRAHGVLAGMETELSQYVTAAARAPAFDKSDLEAYTEAGLLWWRTNAHSFPTWGLSARIVFAISPSSASCGRVFALLKHLFGDEQMSTLADCIRAALWLAHNKRVVR